MVMDKIRHLSFFYFFDIASLIYYFTANLDMITAENSYFTNFIVLC